MSSEAWRGSYDAWKTSEPDDYSGPVCTKCGGWLLRDHSLPGQYWYCEECDEREGPDPDLAYDLWREEHGLGED